MELREIRTFIQVAQRKSFSRAAEALGYSQAAVTIQIKQLENELGIHLFDRIGKQTHLDPSGGALLPPRRFHYEGGFPRRLFRRGAQGIIRRFKHRHHRIHLRLHFPGSDPPVS